MTDSSNDAVLSSLPSRPLTEREIDPLLEDDSGLTPLSITTNGMGNREAYTLWVVADGSDRSYVLGFSEADEGWKTLDTRDSDQFDFEELSVIVDEFLNDEYGDRDKISQVDVGPETGELDQ